ncbi:lysine/arginine/ornithine ABC transporter substrate-binding protein [Thorsellia anophelis]|uniref:Histidine transport system substrate-binding protein n=1 Tax=Thorsellia anophelis DSM 18579 TaxID=1123402 RepID=A0A1H9Y656_9GAMM|nr:lysine/arginine/ornithine ABC transporter substrate-binding protein [Thorsellia anophelis]SES64215.1 histidine transport system substrate-binding protein [Thorsellia anophelis DSM 18579]
MKKSLKLATTAAFGVLFSASTFSALAQMPTSITIATDPTYAPFSFKNPQNQVAGFDVDLGNEICKRINVECKWVESDFDALIPSLKSQKSDAVISSLSITEQRLKEIDFSDKLYAANSRLVAEEGSDIMPTLESLKGKTVGVLQGSTQEAYAIDMWRPQGIEVISYQNQDLVYDDILAGRLDVIFQDEAAASFGFLKLDMGKGYAFAGPAIADEKYFGVGTAMGLRKGQDELKSAVNQAIKDMLADGTYETLAKPYFDFDVYGH